MNATQREDALVAALAASGLPELEGFAIEALGAQVDLEDDELQFSSPTLLIAQTGGDIAYPGGDSFQMAVVAVVPGIDQRVRRQQALDALLAIRYWLPTNTQYAPSTLRTERLHPVAVAGLFATFIG